MDLETNLPLGFSDEQVRFIIDSYLFHKSFDTVSDLYNERWFRYIHLRGPGRQMPYYPSELEEVYDWSIGDERYMPAHANNDDETDTGSGAAQHSPQLLTWFGTPITRDTPPPHYPVQLLHLYNEISGRGYPSNRLDFQPYFAAPYGSSLSRSTYDQPTQSLLSQPGVIYPYEEQNLQSQLHMMYSPAQPQREPSPPLGAIIRPQSSLSSYGNGYGPQGRDYNGRLIDGSAYSMDTHPDLPSYMAVPAMQPEYHPHVDSEMQRQCAVLAGSGFGEMECGGDEHNRGQFARGISGYGHGGPTFRAHDMESSGSGSDGGVQLGNDIFGMNLGNAAPTSNGGYHYGADTGNN